MHLSSNHRQGTSGSHFGTSLRQRSLLARKHPPPWLKITAQRDTGNDSATNKHDKRVTGNCSLRRKLFFFFSKRSPKCKQRGNFRVPAGDTFRDRSFPRFGRDVGNDRGLRSAEKQTCTGKNRKKRMERGHEIGVERSCVNIGARESRSSPYTR